ncbi:MAG: carbohydrate binding family 9 domain-containing protein [Hymenobacteraceae bacterium]|nr:carbohydrate binding family 9 domain-containing protein [Hymenobacteraceae bacterium]
MKAMRATAAPVLDGHLEPEVWQQVPAATNFVRFDPLNGRPSSQRTEVYMLYDNEAVYIGALLHDTAPDSVLTQLGERDSGENNSDMFGVYLDTYNDKQNAFAFLVSAAGVQTDIKISQGQEDRNWDAVWASSVKRHDQGWTVEMKIPYGAIRFPKADVQTWGVNFMRVIRRTREKSYWNHVDNSVEGFVNQEGRAIGIESIESPVRLQFMPYVSGYVNHYPSQTEGQRDVSHSVNGGMDVKYGINDAFTLDVTLIPDFGQTQSDNQVLNLSPFEVKFSENRQFFTEGTELFNKAGLFYSRRIGATPIDYHRVGNTLTDGEEIKENPSVTQLLNAAKVSGRTRKGLGIGVFNAFTKNMYATVEDSASGDTREVLTDPFSNYSVFVLDQTLPRNSFVTFTNTNVTRSKGFYDANVSGLQLRFADNSNTYALRAGGNLSQLYGKDTDGDGIKDGVTLGHQYNVNLAKVSGNLQYGLSHNVESDTYDINDLGYLQNNNEMSSSASISYNFYQPIWRFLSWNNSLSVNHSMLYAPREFVNLSVNGSSSVRFPNFLSAYWRFGVRPGDMHDFFEARTFPQVFIRPPAYETNVGISTDYRRRVALDASTGFWRSNRYDQTSWWIGFSPRFRVNDKFSFVNNNDYKIEHRDIGYAGKDAAGRIIFGDRTVTTFTTRLSGAYIFNEFTGLTLNLRHYWSRAAYQQFYELTEDGLLQSAAADQAKFRDINYNAFNIDLVYSWRFAPGSELRIVWKNAIQDRSNVLRDKYFDNVSHTFQSPQNNNLSVKILYFLDYIAIKNVLSA